MDKKVNKNTIKKERPENYDDKIKVKGSFLDLMKAAVRDAKSKDKKKP